MNRDKRVVEGHDPLEKKAYKAVVIADHVLRGDPTEEEIEERALELTAGVEEGFLDDLIRIGTHRRSLNRRREGRSRVTRRRNGR